MKYAEQLQKALIPVIEALTWHHLFQTGRTVVEMDLEARTRVALALVGAAWQTAEYIVGKQATDRAFALAIIAAQNNDADKKNPAASGCTAGL